MDNKKFNRRDFIKKSSIGMASLAVIKEGKDRAGLKPKLLKDKIIFRELGKTGIRMPVVNMGVMNADNPAVVKSAYEAGIRHFDTAWGYQSGNNEIMVGNVMKELGVRDDVVIATKIMIIPAGRRLRSLDDFNEFKAKHGDSAKEMMKNSFLEMFNTSLKRLQMDFVDILYLHNIEFPEIIEYPALTEALTRLKNENKIKYSGVTTHKNQIAILEKMIEMKFYDVGLVAVSFKYEDRENIKKAMKKANDIGIGMIAMKTQGGRRGSSGTNHTAALKWALKDDYISTAIPGFTTFEQMEEDFSVAYDLKFTKEEEDYLKNYWDGRTGLNLQCQMCEKCLPSCPKDADIPELMRTYMYAAGYNNFVESRCTYNDIPESFNLTNCTDCNTCSAMCPNGLDIANSIKQLKAIYNNT